MLIYPPVVRTLREVRRERTEFIPRFFERSPWFSPIVRAASTFAEEADWPEVDSLGRAFASEPPVRFVPAAPKRRGPRGRRAAPRPKAELYDAWITRRREVPTRPRSWHDYLNALVWATFPRAKLALHERQHRAVEAWVPDGAERLPNARTRELDALALIDEGGVVRLESPGESATLVFGHALYEGLVLENRSMIARAVVLDVDAVPEGVMAQADVVDLALAAALTDPMRLRVPEELPRARLT